ncbi:hypothetical protein ACEWY4_002116 [Coilia grayii]|uniref:C2H2-type domain-containing protein n=1 Tax=Coilia grayii TaxID=363190 RepID=A0ABD1KW39_9TELE
MEREIDEISHHVDASHDQACIDLEKASQFISKALQNEVQRNMALRMLINGLEERVSENGRSLSEQVESNRQLKVQVDKLQKHLEHKDNSLTQANQTIAILKNELRDLQQQLQSHQSNHRTIQEGTEWLQDGESQPNVVKEEDGLLQNLVMGIKEEDVADEEDDGYQCNQSDEADNPTEQTTSLSADIKAELVQEQDEESDMAPVLSSEINQSPPDPASLVKFFKLSVQVVDCCTIQHQQGTDGKNNEDGKEPKNGGGSQLSLSAVPKFTAIPETAMHNEKPYHCSFCGKSFSRKAWLKKHLHIHSGDNPYLKRDQHIDAGETPYQYKPWGKSLSWEGYLEEDQHTVDKPYHCKHCGKGFWQAEALRRHESSHTKDKPYRCKQCGKCFSEAGNLRTHQRIHTGDKPYHCKHCGKCFSHSGNLRRHQHIHTGERPYPCGQCGKAFLQMEDLKRHQRLHSGDKPYHCEQCGKRFAQLHCLRVHHRIHTGERPYPCGQCGKAFLQMECLKRHHRIHTGEKPYHCKQCEKCFSQRGALRRHQRIHKERDPTPVDSVERVSLE